MGALVKGKGAQASAAATSQRGQEPSQAVGTGDVRVVVLRLKLRDKETKEVRGEKRHPRHVHTCTRPASQRYRAPRAMSNT